MPKLRVLVRGPLRERVNGSLKTLYPGTVFTVTDDRAKQLLAITPALVEQTSEKDKLVTKAEDKKAKIAKAKKDADEAK